LPIAAFSDIVSNELKVAQTQPGSWNFVGVPVAAATSRSSFENQANKENHFSGVIIR
jgi:hypothetical protein